MWDKFVSQVFALFVVAPIVHASDTPSVGNLLENFAKTHEHFKSFTAKTESRVEYTVKPNNPNFQRRNSLSFEHCDFRIDIANRKSSARRKLFGDTHSATPNVPKENPQYVSDLRIEGQISIWYGRQNITDDPGRVTLSKAGLRPNEIVQSLSRGYKGHEVLGYFYGSDERFDTILLKASDVRVHPQLQTVGNTKCYLIEGDTPNGQFKVWLAPEYGYNVARAKLILKEGDVLYETMVSEGASYYTGVDNVKFEQIDGVWVPVEADIEYIWKQPGTYDYHEKIHHKVNVYNLNPDHEALGSFTSDDIQDGAIVTIVEANNQILPITYLWQGGKLIPNIDRGAVHQIDTLTESILSKGKTQDESVPLAEILAGYRKTQNSLASFYCESQTDSRGAAPKQFRYAADGRRFSFKLLAEDKTVDTGCIYDGTLSLLKRKEGISASADPNQSYAFLAAHYPGAGLLGYLNGRPERIDTLLQKALPTAAVAVDPIDAKKCLRVTALIGRETYRVWFAPFYGWQVLQAEVYAGDRRIYALEGVEFREIENHWVPVACRVQQADGGGYVYRRSRVELKPDFEALKAFELPISDGSEVRVEGRGGPFFWKNGRITDGEGKDVF